jgi:hypothetical protein
MNCGGFLWRPVIGLSAAKARLVAAHRRAVDAHGRQRKIGAVVSLCCLVARQLERTQVTDT